MEEKVYQVCGWKTGSFTPENGSEVTYTNLYAIAAIDESKNYDSEGSQSFVFKCANPKVLADIHPKDKVVLYFNQYQKVVLIQKV